jgi:Uma2 family endonuclease
MAEPASRKVTVDEFLAWDDGTDRRYELVRGDIVAMAASDQAHDAIVANVAGVLRTQLNSPWRAVTAAGIALSDLADTYYQTDVVVTRGEVRPGRGAVVNPVLIVEVYSESSRIMDRGCKPPDYRALPSVLEILLVSCLRREVEHWRRTSEEWLVVDIRGGATVRLQSVDAELPLDRVYEGVIPPSFSAAAQ